MSENSLLVGNTQANASIIFTVKGLKLRDVLAEIHK